MPTLFSHALVGGLIGGSAQVARLRWRIAAVAAFLAVLPDVDVVAFALDIPYSHPLGHRGFTHSLPFAVLAGLLATAVFVREIPLASRRGLGVAAVLALACASHGVLDAFTDAGRGVGFFVPFDDTRYFLPWRVLATSPIGVERFFDRAAPILANELRWVVLPSLAIAGTVWGVRRVRTR